MNDRFKFKFWDTKEKVMIDWECVCQTAFNHLHKAGNELQRYGLMYNLFTNNLRYIPLQCTDLKDKNGKLIYEGDIVKIPDDYDNFGLMAGEAREVYFKSGGFRLKPWKSPRDCRGHWLEDEDLVEIIGNVYQNPELLESEER